MVVGPPLALAAFGALGAYWYWLLIAAGTAAGMAAVRASAPRQVSPARLDGTEVAR